MSEKRFSYNPFTREYITSQTSHSIALYNRGRQGQFYEFIRGIISNNVLYLRVYYPFEDLDSLGHAKLFQASYKLLKEYEGQILKLVKENEKEKIQEVKYNVENDLLKGIGLANI